METLKIGSTNQYVKLIQNLLARLGPYRHSMDGIYGYYTERAVLTYQTSKRLKSDGIVGPITWKTFYDLSNPYILYAVQGGDSLHDISKKHFTTVSEIVLINDNILLDHLVPGEIIIVPNPTIGIKTIAIQFSDTIESNLEDIIQSSEKPFICELPLISVLLPVYNHARFLKQSIESVQNQSYTNWELIIIDDGSTDETPDILKYYESDYRIQVYRQPNQKAPRTLTHLHELAKGQLITWISSDNFMAPTMLEAMSKYLMQYPDISMVYADPALVKEDGTYLWEPGYRDQNRDEERPYIMRLPQDIEPLASEFDNYINACFLYRRDEAKAMAGHYFDDLNGMEDYDFWLRLANCGKIRHIGNEEPLYYYRVHDQSLSSLIQENHLVDYQNQSQKLLAFNKERAAYCEKSWSVKISRQAKKYLKHHPKLLKRFKQTNLHLTDKMIHLVCPNETINLKNGECFVRLLDGRFDLYQYKNYNYFCIASIELGSEISPLALKARYTHTDNPFWEYPLSHGKKIIGIHLPLSYIDVNQTIKIMKMYESCYFVLINTPENLNVNNANLITEAVDNCTFLGIKEVGSDYWIYSGLDSLLIPPLLDSCENQSIPLVSKSLILCWSIGIWLLMPSKLMQEKSLPFVYKYSSNLYFPDMSQMNDPIYHREVLNRYLESYSYEGCINRLFSLCNLATQDSAVRRPAFSSETYKKGILPKKIQSHISFDHDGWIGICIDALDDEEQMQTISFLAEALISRGIPVKILCTQRAGTLAGDLLHQSLDIHIFDGNAEAFRAYLVQNPPLIINTFNTRFFLDVVHDLNIPIVASILDMYVHFSAEDWQEEKYRSQYFNQLISVSSYVKTYYLMNNNDVSEQQIVIIENTSNSTCHSGKTRDFTRSLLNIKPSDYVFLSIASLTNRKNQLGMMAAYDSFYHHCSKDSKFIFSGRISDLSYYYELLNYRHTLKSKNNIIILPWVGNQLRIEAVGLYQASDLFVLDSYFEGWSLFATQALYNGLPIIHSDCGGGSELCSQGTFGYLVPNPLGNPLTIDLVSFANAMQSKQPQNTQSLITAMNNSWTHRKDWQKKRRQIATHALMRFNSQKILDEYLKVFNNVLKHRK